MHQEKTWVGATVQQYTHLESGIAVRLGNMARRSEFLIGVSTVWSSVVLIRLYGLMFRFSALFSLALRS